MKRHTLSIILAIVTIAVPPPPDPTAVTIFTAVQEQLGLKPDSSKGPVEVLIIDSIDRPSEN